MGGTVRTTGDGDTGSAAASTPPAVAMLRDGVRAAVTVAVVALYLRGAVTVGRRGIVWASGTARVSEGAPVTARLPLEKAVRTALYQHSAWPTDLLEHSLIQQALTELHSGLVSDGLFRTRPPGRTRSGRRVLREKAAELPLPEGATDPAAIRELGWTEDDMLLAVALHGDAALTAVAPRFAGPAGLLRQGRGRAGRSSGDRSGFRGPAGGTLGGVGRDVTDDGGGDGFWSEGHERLRRSRSRRRPHQADGSTLAAATPAATPRTRRPIPTRRS